MAASSSGGKRWKVHSKDRGGDEATLIAPVCLVAQLVIVPSR